MSEVGLLIAMSVLGVDYGWRKADDGQLEYVIQIRPEQLALLQDYPISSELPPQLHSVRRFVIQVGSQRLPRENISPPLLAPPTAASTPSSPPSSTSNWQGIPASGNPSPTGAITYQTPSNAPPSAGRFQPPVQPPVPSSSQSSSQSPPSSSNSFPTHFGNPSRSLPALQTQTSPNSQTPDAASPELHVPAFGGSVSRASSRITAVEAGVAPATRRANTATGQMRNENQVTENERSRRLGGFARRASHQEELQSGSPNSTTAGEDQLGDDDIAETSSDPAEKPWGPLAITTLLLFASIGGNAYLGWIAWGFHRRALALSSRLRRAETP